MIRKIPALLYEDKDGALPLVGMKTIEAMKKIEGSYFQTDESLLIHVFPHEGDKPSDLNTDLKISLGSVLDLPSRSGT